MRSQNNDSNQKNTVFLSAKVIGAKLRGKRGKYRLELVSMFVFLEVYRFCASEVKMYVDDYEHMNVFHMRDQLAKKKKYILANDIRHVNVPQFENLTVEDCLSWTKE